MIEAVKLGPAVRGRGAKSNASGRFEATQVEAFDDGWTDEDAPSSTQIPTTITPLRSRTITVSYTHLTLPTTPYV